MDFSFNEFVETVDLFPFLALFEDNPVLVVMWTLVFFSSSKCMIN